MDWYEALKAWQDRNLPVEDAVRIAEVADIWELWELALGADINIKRGNHEHIAAVVKAKRAIERGEKADMLDIIFEMDLIIAGITEDELKQRLGLTWIPTPDGFKLQHLADYERFLALSHQEQLTFLGSLSERDYELYESLMISQGCYRPPDAL
ncbi:hypothetical protein [Rhizobium ruizarguesonis]|uniref:hypothetical protein n=1 Tax=Rhizobium ruizarguesonis TaxID=2081791 RepID=UPI0010321319|nr:hypothetical protein [Rhizobium ruizarguesonis]MBY5896049.1 hypothetical protein [Rhizobium leguminosarum]TBD26774.1 hypothetical protein ELH20_03810 [Rhizobium ruizarguesonis]